MILIAAWAANAVQADEFDRLEGPILAELTNGQGATPREQLTMAELGRLPAVFRESRSVVAVVKTDPGEAARGYIHDFHGGALKLVADRSRGVLVGATLVTPRAGEILGELVLAVKSGTPIRTMADVIHPYPAFNRVLGAAFGELAAKVG